MEPAAVASMTVARLRRHIASDWLRCVRDVREMSLACSSWFRGRDPRLSREAFEARWGPAGLLCAVHDGANGALSMSVKLSTANPVPVPAHNQALLLPAHLGI
jgi:hypothetical protein